ncbi:hypothetical protein PAXRUDRAFT_378283 [Paxillus rubicundulus Ve08.2h10]|uniref:Plastocyanin-like domain-containing protein n=1 Tax=Paxillus rubicundulus Ve08.2h10 TaxID=930991 RepID=A0A0D0DYW4_9AGAM|nr:hypothetical protein PAXRUDRAFT_378283 [Paxillus rubicundulus Ve08.2h10]
MDLAGTLADRCQHLQSLTSSTETPTASMSWSDPWFNFTIDGNPMAVIETDVFEAEPVVIDSLPVFAGQWYSVVVTANQTVGNSWIRVLSDHSNQTFDVHEPVRTAQVYLSIAFRETWASESISSSICRRLGAVQLLQCKYAGYMGYGVRVRKGRTQVNFNGARVSLGTTRRHFCTSASPNLK